MVSGAAAVLWSQHPNDKDWDAKAVRRQLEQTARPTADNALLGGGRLDLWEAVFNGSFENPDLAGDLALAGWKPYEWWSESWKSLPRATTTDGFAGLGPVDGSRMMYMEVGTGQEHFASLQKEFDVKPGYDSITISFYYNFITEDTCMLTTGCVHPSVNDSFDFRVHEPEMGFDAYFGYRYELRASESSFSNVASRTPHSMWLPIQPWGRDAMMTGWRKYIGTWTVGHKRPCQYCEPWYDILHPFETTEGKWVLRFDLGASGHEFNYWNKSAVLIDGITIEGNRRPQAPRQVISACKTDKEGSPVSGWSMMVLGPESASGETDETGCISFSVTTPGAYTVQEEQRDGWPPQGATSFDFNVDPSGGSYTHTFVNERPTTLNGDQCLDIHKLEAQSDRIDLNYKLSDGVKADRLVWRVRDAFWRCSFRRTTAHVKRGNRTLGWSCRRGNCALRQIHG